VSKALAFMFTLNSQYFFKPRKGMGSSPIRASTLELIWRVRSVG